MWQAKFMAPESLLLTCYYATISVANDLQTSFQTLLCVSLLWTKGNKVIETGEELIQ